MLKTKRKEINVFLSTCKVCRIVHSILQNRHNHAICNGRHWTAIDCQQHANHHHYIYSNAICYMQEANPRLAKYRIH